MIKKINNILYSEFIEGRNINEHLFMLIGIFLQLIAWYITKDSLISLISGVTGIISVILCSQRKISFYFFGFIQLGTYMYLAWQQRFYGELIENVFYIITMLIGIVVWLKNYNTEEQIVESKRLSDRLFYIICSIMVFICVLFGYYMKYFTDNTQPFMDSFSTVPAFIAQTLLMLRYREQWIFWIIIDVVSIFMWMFADNWIMVIQFIFWTMNCIYGYRKWK
jgi:nicotinamide mononucleotide transporter